MSEHFKGFTPGAWRVGRKIPLNVYDGDRPVCQVHNQEDALRIVAGMNRVDAGGGRYEMTIDMNEDLIQELGLDVSRVRSIAARISKANLEAKDMGLLIFGGSSGSLRTIEQPSSDRIVAWLKGSFDGGDGGDEFSR